MHTSVKHQVIFGSLMGFRFAEVAVAPALWASQFLTPSVKNEFGTSRFKYTYPDLGFLSEVVMLFCDVKHFVSDKMNKTCDDNNQEKEEIFTPLLVWWHCLLPWVDFF